MSTKSLLQALQRIASYSLLPLLTLAATGLPPAIALGQGLQPQIIELWGSSPAPGSAQVSIQESVTDTGTPSDPQRTIRGIAKPSMQAYWPAKPNGTAALITAGGGYTSLVIDKEGTDIAKWLNSLGVTAFVLKFRLPGEGHEQGEHVPLQDGQRAMRLIRHNAKAWGLDAKRIGVVGFSSGGHTAAMFAVAYGRQVYSPRDAIDSTSARPDFLVAGYGAHSGNARQSLINPQQAPVLPVQKQSLYDAYPTDQLVDAQTPPSFIWHTDEDKSVDSRNSIRFYLALKNAGLPAELHVFKDGRHGVAIRNAQGLPVAAWTQLCQAWMQSLNLLPSTP